MTLQTIEQQIVTEYGVVLGWIKNHTTASIAISIVAAYLAGWLFHGWPL